MAAQIRVVEEQELGDKGLADAAPPVAIPETAPAQHDPQIVEAFRSMNGRLHAVEQAVQNVPKAIGIIRTMLHALGNRGLMTLAMLGCLGLAGATAFAPTWQSLAIFGAFAVLVYLPVAALTYFRGN